MQNFKNYKILGVGSVRVKIVKNLRLEKTFLKRHDVIERIWQAALEKNRHLFNGALLNFFGLKKRGGKLEISGSFIGYKQFFCQRKNPSLKLGIKPVGVSALTILKDKKEKYIVFAKRARNVTLYPGFFELAPSGSIDDKFVSKSGAIDYKSNLLSELFEELAIKRRYVKKISGFAFVLDAKQNVYDIGCEVLLTCSKEFVDSMFFAKEYDMLILISSSDLDNFIKANINAIVPTSLALLNAYHLWQKLL